ncbi:MAG TPA: phospholipase D-like domain-containing protein [Deltaproteobacteria bacterium]|nr:phospholipase D-like domain-containing protein [Deltaproteobacteria bacterium]
MRLLKRVTPAVLPVTYRRNKVALHADGESFFSALISAIQAARHIILLEYYIVRDDSTGQKLLNELSRAIDRGVRVMLMYDYIGCLETPSSYFNALIRCGVELTPFNPPSFRKGIRWFDRRDHRKMVIIDYQQAFLGGFNIGDEYSGIAEHSKRFRDIGFSISGTAVNELVRIFTAAWSTERQIEPAIELPVPCEMHTATGRANIVIVSGSPHHRKSYIRSAFLFNIASASEDIIIATPYFVPGPRIMRALLRAAQRGVRVRLLLPARSDVPVVMLLGRSSYGILLAGGVEIYEMDQEILHAKVMLVDGERTVIGSANLDQRSFHRNYEINVVIDSRDFANKIHMVLENDFIRARPITIEGHERRGILTRLLEKFVGLFGWFL